MFLTILKQLLILYIFIGIGFAIGKTKAGKGANEKILSVLLVRVFLPCKVFSSLCTNFTTSQIRDNLILALVSLVLLLCLFAFSFFTSKKLTKNLYGQKVYTYSLTVSNYAYMGYALAESLFGAMGLSSYIIFCLPFTLYIYTFGFSMLTNTCASVKKGLINPMTISILLGSAFGLLGIKLPSLVSSVVTGSAGCASAVSMILTGLTISAFPFKEMFNKIVPYVFAGIRLLILPFTVGLILKLIGLTSVLPYAVLFTALPCGLNPIVFAKLVGEDCTQSASIVVICHLLSIATIPLCLTVLL